MWTSPLSGPWSHICNPIDLNRSDTWTTHCFKLSKLCAESPEAPDETVKERIKHVPSLTDGCEPCEDCSIVLISIVTYIS